MIASVSTLVAALGISGFFPWLRPAELVSVDHSAPIRKAERIIPDLAGKVLTVRGPVDPETLGPTLMHEHIFIDFQSPRPRPQRPTTTGTVPTMDSLIEMSRMYSLRYGMGVAGASFLGDFEEMRSEVLEFKKLGGGTIVDVSSLGLGRDPKALFEMSNVTGLSLVMGSSWYTRNYHPLDMDQRSVDELAEMIVRDITEGVDGTGIRSGIIGEVGIDGGPLTPNEIKVTRASARAARITGAPITFHAGGVDEERLVTIDAVLSEGVRPDKIIMGHSGALTPRMDLVRKILAKGVYLQIDWLGVINGPAGVLGNRSDRTIARAIAELVQEGYADRILLSHDICTKAQLRKYGGTGFAYVLEYFVPELRREGLGEEVIRKIIIENPRRALTFVEPHP